MADQALFTNTSGVAPEPYYGAGGAATFSSAFPLAIRELE
jgi:hypothetical protein